MRDTTGEPGRTTEKSLRKPPFKKGITRLAYLIIAIVLVLTLLPHALGYAIKFGLQSQSEGTVTFEDVNVNLFSGRITVRGLLLQLATAHLLEVPELDIDVSMKQIRDKRIVIERLVLNRASLTVAEQRGAQGADFYIGGVRLPQAPSSPEAAVEAAPSEWSFGINRITIENSELLFLGKETTARLGLKSLSLGALHSWEPENPTALSIDGKVNSAILTIQGEASPLAAQPGASLSVRLDGLVLGDFARLVARHLQTLRGNLLVDSQVDVRLDQAKTLHLTHDGEIRYTNLNIRHPAMNLRGKGLEWQGKSTLEIPLAGGTTTLHPTGTLRLDAIHLASSAMQLDNEQMTLQADTTILIGEAGLDIQHAGSLALDQLAMRIPESGIAIAAGHWTGKASVNLPANPASPLEIRESGEFSLGGFSLKHPAASVDNARLQWNGTTQVSLPRDSGPAISAVGELLNEGLALQLSANQLQVTQDRTQWKGEFNLAADGTPQATGELSMRDSRIQGVGSKQHFLQLGRMDLVALALSGTQNIAIQDVNIRDLDMRVLRNTDGSLQLPVTAEPASTTVEPARPADKPALKPQFTIGRIQLAGNNRILFHDTSVTPEYQQTLFIESLKLEPVDSTKPAQPSRLALKAKLGDYATLNATGTVSPFTQRPTLDLKGKLKSLELPPVSSYAAPKLGYNLDSGMLDSEFHLKLVQGELDSEVQLHINNLELKAVSTESEAKFLAQLSMPLGTALSILKDGDNNIHLNLPISGDIDSPKFNISDVINIALAKGMKSASLSYLKHALQPYGMILTMIQLGQDLSKGLPLDPIIYTAGDSSLSAQHKDYMDKLGAMLKERPGMRLRLCGKAIEDDRTALLKAMGKKPEEKTDKKGNPLVPDNTLYELARQRAEQAKDYMVNEHKVDPSRLFICNPEIDKASDAKPRSDVRL